MWRVNDRWKIQIKDLNHEPSILCAEPEFEKLTEFVMDAVNELRRKCAIAEEHMIFGSSPTETLIRIRDFCAGEIERRAKGAQP
jgi:hypothetical protein